MTKIKYQPEGDTFYKVLRQRVDQYFVETKQSKYANGAMYWKTFFLLSLYFGTYALMLSNWFLSWDLFIIQVTFHFTMFMIAVGIAHDGSHHSYSSKRWVNNLLEYSFDMVGINSHFWTYNHVHAHHNAPNVPLVDSAIESFALIRFHPKTKRSRASRYQHIYMFGIYAFVTLFQVFLVEFASFFQKAAGYSKNDGHNVRQVATMVLSKFIIIGYTLIIPLMVIHVPAWQILAGFFVGHFISGISLGIIFEPTHLHMKTEFPEPDENGMMKDSFSRHILKTTADFSTGNFLITWISGGLNLHTIHHLFPHISQTHLPALVKILRSTAKEYNIAYWEYSLAGAIRSHLQFLKMMGNAPSYQPFSYAKEQEAK